MSRTVTKTAITIARPIPRRYCAPRKKLTTRFAIRLPDAPPTSDGVRKLTQDRDEHEDAGRDDAGADLGQENQAECLVRARTQVLAALNWAKSNFSSAAYRASAANGKYRYHSVRPTPKSL